MRNIKLRPAIALVILFCFLLPVLLAGWLTMFERKIDLWQRLEEDQNRILDILVLGVQESLWTLHPDAGLPLVRAIMTDSRVVHVLIESEDGIFLQSGEPIRLHPDVKRQEKPIFYQGKIIGKVIVVMDTTHLMDVLTRQITSFLLIVLIPFLLSMSALYFLLEKKLLSPLGILIRQSERLAEKNLDTPFVWSQKDEMGLLGQSLEKTRKSLHAAFTELEKMHREAVRISQDQAEVNRQLQHEIGERISIEKELRHHKDNLEETVQERTRALVVANETLLQEIEERRKAEEERHLIALKLHRAEKMEALGVLASGVAHDLNNILAGIVSYPDLLLLKIQKDSDLYQPLQEIQGAGKRAAAVVADLLTIARSTTTTFVDVDLHDLVVEYFNSPEFQQLESGYLALTLDLHLKAARPVISCSPVHVKKCLMNIITNAFEASSNAGQIVVTTANEAEKPADDGDEIVFVVLSVCDSGPGIPQADLEHIFEPFYSTKQLGMSGSGLGLTIVWNTMEEHGGRVTVQSGSTGTCFRLHFPCLLSDSQAGRQKDPERYARGNGEMILVVDDEEILRRICKRMLSELGYRVETVSSGEQAIEFLRENPVDAVVLDMVMDPGISGKQTYEKMIEIRPGQRAMIVSGFAMNSDIRAALQLGVSIFLKKPYTMEELASSLHQTLSSEPKNH